MRMEKKGNKFFFSVKRERNTDRRCFLTANRLEVDPYEGRQGGGKGDLVAFSFYPKAVVLLINKDLFFCFGNLHTVH